MDVNLARMGDLIEKMQTDKLRSDKQNDKLKKACDDFEGILLNFMFQAMEKTVGKGGVFGDSFQSDMYESMFLQKVAQKASEEQDLGLGNTLYRQLRGRMAAGARGGDGAGAKKEMATGSKTSAAADPMTARPGIQGKDTFGR